MSFNDFFIAIYGFFVTFFSSPFVTNFYLIALAGLGMIYIIKSFIFIRRSS